VKLSIAMCTYNGARYIQEQLDSIALQTRPPGELVVCDDRSSDETRKLVEDFARRAPFPVRLSVNEKTLGPSQNFARAISLCRGELIFLSDQDDVWHTEKLARMESVFDARSEVGLVFTDAEIVDMSLRSLGHRAWECGGVEFGAAEQRLFNASRAVDVLLTRNVVTGATIAFRSSFKELILPIPDESAWMLHDYWIASLIAAVSNVAYIDEPLVKYRRHPDQHTGLPAPAEFTGDASPARTDAFNQAYPIKHNLLRLTYERLAERNKNGQYREAISKLAHLRTRAQLRRDIFVVRACRALKELLMLRYHLYSGGLRSAAKDISVPHKVLQLSALFAGSQEAARSRDKQQ
jgi:glycosyltransferase involved in cell wall biosynthesis